VKLIRFGGQRRVKPGFRLQMEPVSTLRRGVFPPRTITRPFLQRRAAGTRKVVAKPRLFGSPAAANSVRLGSPICRPRRSSLVS